MKRIWILAAYKKESIDEINRVAFDYTKAVEEAWGTPYIIPCNITDVSSYVEDVDGFILPGWGDIDPSLYGETANGAENPIKENDIFTLTFLREIIKKKKKVLGICRGMQLMNVEAGGNLVQHISNAEFHNQYEKQYEYIDSIRIEAGSFLEKAFGKLEIPVNSIHHQSINNLGGWYRIAARSMFDNTIEAIEHEILPLYGVQWHPESLMEQRSLFQWFISL